MAVIGRSKTRARKSCGSTDGMTYDGLDYRMTSRTISGMLVLQTGVDSVAEFC